MRGLLAIPAASGNLWGETSQVGQLRPTQLFPGGLSMAGALLPAASPSAGSSMMRPRPAAGSPTSCRSPVRPRRLALPAGWPACGSECSLVSLPLPLRGLAMLPLTRPSRRVRTLAAELAAAPPTGWWVRSVVPPSAAVPSQVRGGLQVNWLCVNGHSASRLC